MKDKAIIVGVTAFLMAVAGTVGCGSTEREDVRKKSPGLAGENNKQNGDSSSTNQKDIVGIAASDEQFSTLVAAVNAAGLAETLRSKGPFTVFAPTNEAFAKLGDQTIKNLLNDKERLKDILLYHVISGAAVDAQAASVIKDAKMANGGHVKLSFSDGNLRVNDSKVVAKDIKASNGIIHVIDTVLLPPAGTTNPPPAMDPSTPPATLKDIVTIASEDSRFSTLVTAIKTADLVDTLKGAGPFTVFAPTNDAFAKLGSTAIANLLNNKDALRNILLYHVVSGAAVSSEQASKLSEALMANSQKVQISLQNGSLYVNQSKVILKDIKASNGVIHVLDTVLVP